MQFLTDDTEFAVEAYRQAVDILILAQEIIVDNASYPTPAIERRCHFSALAWVCQPWRIAHGAWFAV